MLSLRSASEVVRSSGATRTCRGLLLALLAALPALAACEAGGDAPVDGPADAGAACATGFEATASGACAPLLPGEACPPGTMAVPGQPTCVPVGWRDCPAGFRPHPSGHGCIDLLPSQPCQGASREALGEERCRPIGDCDAPFPPPDATIFVNPRFSDAQLDATHHRRIHDAYKAAPEGAVIAVERGTYHDVTTVRRSLRIVGRCAAQVVLEARVAAHAFAATDGARLSLSGITLRGYTRALVADARSSLVFEDGVIDAAVGLATQAQVGGTLRLLRSAVRDTVPDADGWGTGGWALSGRLEIVDSVIARSQSAGLVASRALGVGGGGDAHLVVLRSLVTEVRRNPVSGNAFGVVVSGGAAAELEESVLARADQAGLVASGEGVRVALVRSVVRDTVGVGDSGQTVGLVAQDGARLELREAQVSGNASGGVLVINPGTVAALRDVTVVGTLPGAAAGRHGVTVAYGARASLERVAIVDNEKIGLFVGVDGAEVEARGLLVSGTRPDLEGMRRGLSVEDGVLRVDGGAFRGNGLLGLFVGGPGAAALLTRVLMDDAPTDLVDGERVYGYGALARFQGRLDLDGCVMRGAEAVGLAFADRGFGVIRRSLLTGNGVALHAQSGSRVEQVAAPPEPLPPGMVAVTGDVAFVDNVSSLGAGVIALPSGLGL